MRPFREVLPILAGPTGSGKTSLSTLLDPDRFEIVSFDSRQVYFELPIGTTMPTSEERNKIPHWLVGTLTADKSFNAREYATWARAAVTSIWERGKTPLLVCGTGFYLRAFLYGMYPVPQISLEIKEEALSLPLEEAISIIMAKDPSALKNIGESDEYRIRRALEVILTGSLWSEVSKETVGGFLQEFPELKVKGYWIDWPRDLLYSRINERVNQLFQNGMIDETKEIVLKYGEKAPGLQSLGYNFALDFLGGKIDINSFLERLAQSHRNYAKRQVTWFRKDPLLLPVPWETAIKELKI